MGMDPVSAGIGAASSIAGGAIQGKGAKKAAKVTAAAQAQNRAQLQGFYNDGVQRYQGDINTGDAARDVYSGLLGTGGNQTASNNAFNTWRNSTNYNFVQDQAQGAVNANAYAQGMGRSGAVMKALQDRSGDVANGYLQQYMGNLQTQVGNGMAAKSALTGVGTTMVNGTINANNTQADASSNAILKSADAWTKAIGGVGKSATDVFGSSYGSPSKTTWI